MRRRWTNPYIHVEVDPLSDNQILYTTTDGKIVDVAEDAFEANLIQNTYIDGQGMLLFDSPITFIGQGAFNRCDNLKTINLPPSVVVIDSGAFSMCTNLSNINLPNNLLTISNYAFQDCWSLCDLNIPSTVTYIGYNAFKSCVKLVNVTIPDSVVSLEGSCFEDCTNLKEVNLGRGIETIKARTFTSCTSLFNVYIGENVSSIKSDAFYNCNNLKKLSFKCKNIPDFGFNVLGTALDSIRTQITTINLEPTVQSIQSRAFWNFTSLKTLNVLTTQLKTIESSAFGSCINLYQIDISKQSQLQSIETSAFYDCGSSENAPSVTSIKLPDNITEIGDGAFKGCKKLQTINIPKKLKILGDRAFEDCTSLKEIKLPEGMTELGRNAFKNCTSLKKINIPKSLKTVKEGCFQNVDLDTIDLADINSYLSIQYSQTSSSDYSCYPANNGAVFTLQSAPLTKVPISPDTHLIPPHAFHWKSGKDCTINTIKVTQIRQYYYFSIGDYAFYGCKNDISLYMMQMDGYVSGGGLDGLDYTQFIEIETIGKYAFAYCRLIVYDYQYSHGNWIFREWTCNLRAKTFEEYSFYKCTFPKQYGMNLTATTIKTNSFYDIKFARDDEKGEKGRPVIIWAYIYNFETQSLIYNNTHYVQLMKTSISSDKGGEAVTIKPYAFNPNTVTVSVSWLNKPHYVNQMENWLSKDRIHGDIID